MSRNYQRPYRTPVQPSSYSNIRRQPSVESFRSAAPSPYIRNQPNPPSVASNTEYYRKEPVSRPNSTVYGYHNQNERSERPGDRPSFSGYYYNNNQYDRPPSTARTEFEEPNVNARRVYKTRSALNVKPSFPPTTSYQREPYREPSVNGSNYQPHISSQSQYDGYYPSQRESSTYSSVKPYSQPYASSNIPPPPSSNNQYQQNAPTSYNQGNYQELNYRRSQEDLVSYREPSEAGASVNYRNESSRTPGYQSGNPPPTGGYTNIPSPGYRKDIGPPPTSGYRKDVGAPPTTGYRNEGVATGQPYRTQESAGNTGPYRNDQSAPNYGGYQPEISPIYESPQEGRQYDAFRIQKEEKQQLPETIRQNSKKVESMLSHARSGSGISTFNLDVTKQKQESVDFINLQALSVQDPPFETLKQIYNLSREMAALVLERTTSLTHEEWELLVEKIQVQSHLVASVDTI